MAVQWLVAVLYFLQEKMSTHPSTPPSSKELINHMDIPKCTSLPIITISFYDIIIAKCISHFIIVACLGLLFLILERIFIT